MPHIIKAQEGQHDHVVLTDRERALVNGMNSAAVKAFSNIAALHFDGEVLAEMVYAHRQIANAEPVR